MNRNENEQFKKFEAFIERANMNKDDIFYGAQMVEATNIKAYDAIVNFPKGNKKYVQLTTMSNLVLKNKIMSNMLIDMT